MDTETTVENDPETASMFVGAFLVVSAGYTVYRAGRGAKILAVRGFHAFKAHRNNTPES